MVDLVTSGKTTLGGLTGVPADTRVLRWVLTLLAPAPTEVLVHLAPTLTFTVTADPSMGATCQVQVQVASSTRFDVRAWETTLVDAPIGEEVGVQASGLADRSTYFWRARAGDGTTWGTWSPPRPFHLNTRARDAVEYVYLNQGIEITPSPDGAEHTYLNVGVEHTPDPDGPEYTYLNVGVQPTPDPDAVDYAYLGRVDESVPTPHIWFLIPTKGAWGDAINVYGWGFGALRETYNGNLEYQDPSTDGWVGVSIVEWSTKPPGPDAYTAARIIDPVTATVTPQHTIVQFVVPTGALPPGVKVRMVTDGAP